MSALRQSILQAQGMLRPAATALIDAGNEYVLWRRQHRDRLNPDADNPQGESVSGLRYQTSDTYVRGRLQGLDALGQQRIYMQVAMVRGDLIATLAGTAVSPEGAAALGPEAWYRVVDTDIRRDPDGRVIYGLALCVPFRTGQQ